MSRERKLHQLAKWLHQASLAARLDCGGYPDEIEIVCDHIVIASADECGRPSLEILPPEYAERWYESVRQYPSRDIVERVNESRPEEIA